PFRLNDIDAPNPISLRHVVLLTFAFSPSDFSQNQKGPPRNSKGASYAGRSPSWPPAIRCSGTKPRLLAKIGLHPQLKRDSGRGAAASIIVRMSLDFTECGRARLARDPVYG